MICKFNPTECSPECAKFSLCSFMEVQSQLSGIQTQLNTLYQTVAQLSKFQLTEHEKISSIEENLEDAVSVIAELWDSELKE